MSVADDLIDRLEGEQWPLDRHILTKVALHRALREADDGYLKSVFQWGRARMLVADPLPAQIAAAHADLLFGDEAAFVASAESDQDNLDQLVNATDSPSELHRAARISSSEGEVWWRAYVDREASDYPLLQWVSRLDVVPLWRGGRPVAIAFISVLEFDYTTRQTTRHIEVQAPGETRNLLYEGDDMRLGDARSLGAHVETADLPEEWRHEPLMLAGRIVNRHSDTGVKLGRSDYSGLETMMMALNEATTIQYENARTSGKKRLFVKGEYLDSRGQLPGDEDVFRADDRGGTLGDDKSGIAQAEYTFEADALIAHTDDLISRIAMRAGLVAAWIGMGEEGRAESGTALRVRLLPATRTAKGKSRFWVDALPRIFGVLQLLDSMREMDGGFGRAWADAAGEPMVELGDPIPTDGIEEAERGSLLVTAGLQSRETTIRELHSEWTDAEVMQEVARIAAETAERMPDFGSDEGVPDREDEEIAA